MPKRGSNFCRVALVSGRVRAWRDSGSFADVEGHRIYMTRREGRGKTILLLHGYPSSSYDFRPLLDRLAGLRVVAFDFLGFGLSDKPRRHIYSLHGQADLAEAIAERLGGGPVWLVAHDMGTSVATELLARSIEGRLRMKLAGVLLFNGSMVLEKANLTIAQRLLRSRFGPIAARLSSERVFRAQFSRIFSREHPLTNEDAEDAWALLSHHDGHRIIDRLTYYLHERVAFAERWHGALRNWPGHLELAWAMRDPVCVPAVLDAVRELRPAAPVVRFPSLGHYPQIEAPAAVAEVVLGFAARGARGRSIPSTIARG
ncbi:MAG: alpha/beta fold hydrolase [Polyangiaceae bacterium]